MQTYIDLLNSPEPFFPGGNFTHREVYKKSAEKRLNSSLPWIMEQVRKWAGNTPVKVNSADRDHIPPGGAQNSKHLAADAVDLGLTKKQLNELNKNLIQFLDAVPKLTGLGIYPWGIHIDVGRDMENDPPGWD